MLYSKEFNYKTPKLKPSKAKQKLNAHAFYRHKEDLPTDDAMGIDVTGRDVHVEGPGDTLNILGIHNTREDLHDGCGSKHANGSIKGRNIPDTNDDNIHETNDKKDLPIDTKKDL